MRLSSVAALLLLGLSFLYSQKPSSPQANPPIYISFLWHMHQPIYWPYESVVQTEQNARYPYSVVDIFNQRIGPYTTWPGGAVQKAIAAGLPHAGAQVSFSGSLIENLNNLEAAGNGNFSNWKSTWNTVKTETTSLGNPRLDMVGFGYHHPLMGLIDYDDTRRQIEAHKQIMSANFSGAYSRGIFPPENAFSPREIPAFVDEGLQWVLVDNIHFDRACQGYPFSTAGNLYEPNGADQRNPNPNDWIQLNGLWAPTLTSARWGRQPHYVQWVDPASGNARKIVAVPADRYMGNEDGRGGFGALNYESVMSQLESYNTDSEHPILIVLHHDGDNYGGGSDSYYNANFQSFVNWLLANPTRFVCTTVQDYLDQFPPDTNDVIHIEDGSWSGADNGDPEFLKWNGDPVNGYSPDRNSWGVVTAAKNIVETAQQVAPLASATQNAWKYMLNGEASDYWYWDGSQNGIWDSHPTRACNQAVQFAQPVASGGTDLTPPTVYLPQREPYNPGGTEWGINQPSNFTVWTYAYDLSGLRSVTLNYRTSAGSSVMAANELYAGGAGVGAWNALPMTGTSIAPQTNPLPIAKALQYSAVVSGLNSVLADYYVEAVDSNNNIARSPIRHVWIGASTSGGPGNENPGVSWLPASPTTGDSINITVAGATQGASLHWGVNNSGSTWQQPNPAYWPSGSSLFGGTGPAIESPMIGPDTAGKLHITLPPFSNNAQPIQRVAFVIHYNNNTWDNNGGGDYHITIGGAQPGAGFLMDGVLDSTAFLLDSAQGMKLYIGWNGSDIYLATPSAPSQGGDLFLLVADSQRALVTAPWAKNGQVAGWDAFLANESSNNWSGWFNKTQGTLSATSSNTSGTFLEGTVNLSSLFGVIPSTVFIAAARYQTADGGALLAQVPSGNGNGNIDTSEFVRYAYAIPALPPPAPVPVFPGNGSGNRPLSLTFRWNHVASALFYALQLATDSTFSEGVVVDDTALADTSRPAAGLATLTRYFWRVRAFNLNGASPWSATRMFTTIPPMPGVPILHYPADQAVGLPKLIAFSWDSVGHADRYELEVALDSGFAAIFHADTALLHAGANVDSLTGGTTWFWRVRSANAAGKSDWSQTFTFSTSNLSSVLFRVLRRWNLISLPVVAVDRSISALFPGAASQAFRYEGASYQPDDSIRPSIGYWLEFGDSATLALAGVVRRSDTIQLASGWNLIGAIGETLAAGSISTSPASIIGSSFFGYDGSYFVAGQLLPGKGYWVRAEAPGTLFLESGTNMMRATAQVVDRSALGRLAFLDADGHAGTLYWSGAASSSPVLLPPPPPEGAFDIRFATGRSEEYFNSSRGKRVPIVMRSAAYPVTISWDAGALQTGVTLLVSGKETPLVGTGSTTLSCAAALELTSAGAGSIPHSFALEQNYPNPFNPQTTIRFALPVQSPVRLSLYNLLGEEVGRPVDGVQNAGYHEIVVDATRLPSGLYLYRISAGKWSDLKKMLLIK